MSSSDATEDLFSYEFSSLAVSTSPPAPSHATPAPVGPTSNTPSLDPPHENHHKESGLPSIPASTAPRAFYSMHAPEGYVPPRVSAPVRISRPPAKPTQATSSARTVTQPSHPASDAAPAKEISSTQTSEARSEWDVVLDLLHELDRDYQRALCSQSTLSQTNASLSAQLAYKSDQLEEIRRLTRMDQGTISRLEESVRQLEAERASLIERAEEKIAHVQNSFKIREGQFLQHIQSWERSHKEVAQTVLALRQDKTKLELELTASRQQLQSLRLEIDKIPLSSHISREGSAQPRVGVGSAAEQAQHETWDALLVRENDDLRQQLALIDQEKVELVEREMELEAECVQAQDERCALMDEKRELERSNRLLEQENRALEVKLAHAQRNAPEQTQHLATPPHSPESRRSSHSDSAVAGLAAQRHATASRMNADQPPPEERQTLNSGLSPYAAQPSRQPRAPPCHAAFVGRHQDRPSPSIHAPQAYASYYAEQRPVTVNSGVSYGGRRAQPPNSSGGRGAGGSGVTSPEGAVGPSGWEWRQGRALEAENDEGEEEL